MFVHFHCLCRINLRVNALFKINPIGSMDTCPLTGILKGSIQVFRMIGVARTLEVWTQICTSVWFSALDNRWHSYRKITGPQVSFSGESRANPAISTLIRYFNWFSSVSTNHFIHSYINPFKLQVSIRLFLYTPTILYSVTKCFYLQAVRKLHSRQMGIEPGVFNGQ